MALSVSFIPLGWLGTEFTPQEDNSQFSVNVQLPIGTPLDQTQQVIDQLDQQIRAMPGVTHTYVYTQTTKDPGIANGAMVDLVNVLATSIVDNGTTLSVVDVIVPNAPTISSITESSDGVINGADASDGTPVVVESRR